MDIYEIHAQVTAEIGNVQAAIKERDKQIAELEALNEEAQDRVVTLEKAVEALDRALEKIKELGALDPLSPITSSEMKPRTRTPIKKPIIGMLEVAGLPGMTVKEILKRFHELHGQELKETSLNSFLSVAKKTGYIERRPNGCWRLVTKQSEAA